MIKIERPGVGDFARGYDATVNGLSSHFVWLNRSKESLTLDVKRPESREVISRLLERADVFLQNLAPGATERLGLGTDTLRARYPRLIVCGISGYGATGPFRDHKAYDLLVQAESGLVSITGSAEEPAKVGVSVADIAAGMYALTGILTALIARSTTASFFPAKPLGCYGDGGAVLTTDTEVAIRLRSLRVHGQGTNKYDNVRVGYNSRLDTVQAAVLLARLDVFSDELRRRKTVADRYAAGLAARGKSPTAFDRR